MNDEDIPVLNRIGDQLVSAIADSGGTVGSRRALLAVPVGAVVLALVAFLLATSGSHPGDRVELGGSLRSASPTTLRGGLATASNSPSTTALPGGAVPGSSVPGSSAPASPGSAPSGPTTTRPRPAPTTVVTTPPMTVAPGVPAPPASTTTLAPRTGRVEITGSDNGKSFTVSVGTTIEVALPTDQYVYGEPATNDSGVVEQTGGTRDQAGASGQFVAVAPGSAQIQTTATANCPPKVACPMFALLWTVTINVAG